MTPRDNSQNPNLLGVGEPPTVETLIHLVEQHWSHAISKDTRYKMGQKARNGGTIGKAPLGYLNITARSEGRTVHTVVIDEERAPYITSAFELYATGEWTLHAITLELAKRGLTTRATNRWPAKQVTSKQLSKMLRDRYYTGVVTYKGEEYPGLHPALVNDKLFQRVQDMLDAHIQGSPAPQEVLVVAIEGPDLRGITSPDTEGRLR